MQIEKKFLTVAPQQTESKIESVLEVTVRDQTEKIKELEEKVKKLESVVDFLAQFESSLINAISDEEDLLDHAAKVTQNQTQKSIFINLALALNRTRSRVSNGSVFIVNESEMKIEKIVNKDE